MEAQKARVFLFCTFIFSRIFQITSLLLLAVRVNHNSRRGGEPSSSSRIVLQANMPEEYDSTNEDVSLNKNQQIEAAATDGETTAASLAVKEEKKRWKFQNFELGSWQQSQEIVLEDRAAADYFR